MKAKGNLIIAMLVFGSVGLFVRHISFTSSQIALIRGVVGAEILILAVLFQKKRIDFQAIRKNGLVLILSGAAIGFNWICLFEAYRYTTIATATLCYYFAPVFLLLVSPFLFKEKLTPMKGVCILASMAGMFLVADAASHSAESGQLKGVSFGLLAALLYAGVMICNKFLKQISAIDSTISQLFIASVVLIPYVILTGDMYIPNINVSSAVCVIIVGVVHTGICYVMYFSSIQELKGQTVAVYSYLDPVTAILLSAIVLRERMKPSQVAGAVLILGATFLSEVSERPGKHEKPKKADNK